MSDAIRSHALRYLAQRTTTRGHLRELLLRGALKRDPETRAAEHLPAIDVVLDELCTIGAVDDDAWMASRVASLRRQGNSPAVIRAKLRAKRVAPDRIDACFADAAPDADLVAALRHLRKRRLGPWAPQIDVQAAITRLGRAGFAYDVARRAASMELDDARALAGW